MNFLYWFLVLERHSWVYLNFLIFSRHYTFVWLRSDIACQKTSVVTYEVSRLIIHFYVDCSCSNCSWAYNDYLFPIIDPRNIWDFSIEEAGSFKLSSEILLGWAPANDAKLSLFISECNIIPVHRVLYACDIICNLVTKHFILSPIIEISKHETFLAAVCEDPLLTVLRRFHGPFNSSGSLGWRIWHKQCAWRFWVCFHPQKYY